MEQKLRENRYQNTKFAAGFEAIQDLISVESPPPDKGNEMVGFINERFRRTVSRQPNLMGNREAGGEVIPIGLADDVSSWLLATPGLGGMVVPERAVIKGERQVRTSSEKGQVKRESPTVTTLDDEDNKLWSFEEIFGVAPAVGGAIPQAVLSLPMLLR